MVDVTFTPYSIKSNLRKVPRLGYFTPRMGGAELGTWVLQKHFAQAVEELEQARGVVVHPNGDIAIADVGSKQVFVYNRSGDLKFGLTSPFGSDYSHGIAVSADGRYFVTGLNQSVDVFNAEGTFQYKFAAKSPSNTPSDQEDTQLIGITVDSTTQHLLVADIKKKYISKHQLDGTHIGSIEVDLEPWYMAVTSQSTIVASSYRDHAVHMIRQDGQILQRCSIPSGMTEHEWCPTGICLAQDTIYVNNFSQKKSGVYCFCALMGNYLGQAISPNHINWPTGIAAVEDGGPKLLVAQGMWNAWDSGVKIFAQE